MSKEGIILYDRNKNKLVVKKPLHMIAVHKKYLLVQGAKSIIVLRREENKLVVKKPSHMVVSSKDAIVVKKPGHTLPRGM